MNIPTSKGKEQKSKETGLSYCEKWCSRKESEVCYENGTCAVKGAGLQRVQIPPGNWFAPPGSNRGSSGGNETAEAFDGKGSRRRLS
jgi:hypothetical protein